MNDDRIVQNPNMNPFDSVVAVDATFATSTFNGVGSGIVIGPSHVLTAGHVVVGGATGNEVAQNARVLLSTNVAATAPRVVYTTNASGAVVSVTTPIPSSINVTVPPFFPLNFPSNTRNNGSDIALLTTQAPITTAQNSLGIVVFLDPNDIVGAPITTGGYPGTFSDGTQDSRTDDNTARTLYSATGTVHDAIGSSLFGLIGTDTRISYSEEVDTQGGQSGSGVWYDGDLFGEMVELVAAIHTRGVNNVFNNNGGDNSGVLISKEIYDLVVAQMEADSGTTNANVLPENAIIGTDPSTFFVDPVTPIFLEAGGEDFITGSYLRERIIGKGGNDRLFGGGANDRLEGGSGVDQAIFTHEFTEYTVTIIDPNQKTFEISHTGGTMAEGIDTTKEIEFAVFEFNDANNDGRDDGILETVKET